MEEVQPTQWEIDGYIATLTVVTDDPAGGRVRMEIRAHDSSMPPFVRTFYYDEATDRHYRNFARKFATDPAYRTQCLSGTAPWQEVDWRYQERAMELYAIFARKDRRFLPSAHFTPEEQAIHEQLWAQYRATLYRIYQRLKSRFNPPPSRPAPTKGTTTRTGKSSSRSTARRSRS
ncbi:MAG: hypothetical protein D6736_02885 [Nitrospinota bacterium]|nr:MAG: hypothetical protein D6736_02885 [Nitrospinota bacterium]